MKEGLRGLGQVVADVGAERCALTHGLDGGDITGANLGVREFDGVSVDVWRHARLEEVIVVGIEGKEIEGILYVKLLRVLADSGIHRIELASTGWWIGDLPLPSRAIVADHVACHLPSPLTGSAAAKQGGAFLSMRDAYDQSFSALAQWMDEMQQGVPEVVVWHSGSVKRPSGAEVESARSAGCSVMSGRIAPWTVGARAAGCAFSAIVELSALA